MVVTKAGKKKYPGKTAKEIRDILDKENKGRQEKSRDTLSRKKERSKSDDKALNRLKGVLDKPTSVGPTIELKPTGKGASIADKAAATLTHPIDTLTGGFEEGVKSMRETSPGENTLRAVAGGAAIGGTIVGGISLAGSIAARAATRAAVQSGFAQQAKAIPGKLTDSAVVGSAGRFITNTKTTGLTKTLLGKAGLTIGATGILVTLIGSYPFAGFIKEEALQTLSFATRAAMDAEDFEGAQVAIDQVSEILNPTAWDEIIGMVPYANVLKQLKEFYLAAATKNANDQEALNRAIGEQSRLQEQGESDFAKERREGDEVRAEEDKRVALVMQDVWRLRREKKYEEADELERTVL